MEILSLPLKGGRQGKALSLIGESVDSTPNPILKLSSANSKQKEIIRIPYTYESSTSDLDPQMESVVITAIDGKANSSTGWFANDFTN